MRRQGAVAKQLQQGELLRRLDSKVSAMTLNIDCSFPQVMMRTSTKTSGLRLQRKRPRSKLPAGWTTMVSKKTYDISPPNGVEADMKHTSSLQTMTAEQADSTLNSSTTTAKPTTMPWSTTGSWATTPKL